MPTETVARFGVRPTFSVSVLVLEGSLTCSVLLSSLDSFGPLPPLGPRAAAALAPPPFGTSPGTPLDETDSRFIV